MDCVELLQWALPRMRLRWRGFRRVRGQVCKRIKRRARELGLADLAAYRAYLETTDAEWLRLDAMCRVTISRFYRDRGTFEQLRDIVFPALRERDDVTIWSAGAASGEEAYSVAILWVSTTARPVRVVATDSDPAMIERAQRGVYESGSLKELPEALRARGLVRAGDRWTVEPHIRRLVHFETADIRTTRPGQTFDLILCRNLVLTYFDRQLQRELLPRVLEHLRPGGFFVKGAHESLPEGYSGLTALSPGADVYEVQMPV